MKLILALLIVCVVAAQGYRQKKGDAFCNPDLTLAEAIEYEYLLLIKAATKANATVYASTTLALSKLDRIIAEKFLILDEFSSEITATENALFTELEPYIDDPEVPFASIYKAEVLKLTVHTQGLIVSGKPELAKPYQDFKSNFSIVTFGLEKALIDNLETTFTNIVGKITDGNTTCACKSLRHFAKVSLDLVNAALACGTEEIADLTSHSKLVNKIVIAGKLTFLAFILDGQECLSNVARRSNSETKALLNACLEIQTLSIAEFNPTHDIYAGNKFAVSAIKAFLLKNKFYRCMETTGFEFLTFYTFFQNEYNECQAVSSEALSLAVFANVLGLLNLNVTAGLGLGNLLSLPNIIG